MQPPLEFDDLLSSGSSLIGRRLAIKGFMVVETKRCYLLKDEEASEYGPKIEIYAPGLQRKIRESPAGIYARVGGAAIYFGYVIISGMLYEPTLELNKFSISNIENIIFFPEEEAYHFDFKIGPGIG